MRKDSKRSKRSNEWWVLKGKQPAEQSAVDERLANQKFYQSKEWRRFRNYVLSIFEPICDCGRLITNSRQIHLHHVHQLSTAEGKRLSLSLYDDHNQLNILIKCWHCHAAADHQIRREQQPGYKSIDDAMKEFEI